MVSAMRCMTASGEGNKALVTSAKTAPRRQAPAATATAHTPIGPASALATGAAIAAATTMLAATRPACAASPRPASRFHAVVLLLAAIVLTVTLTCSRARLGDPHQRERRQHSA